MDDTTAPRGRDASGPSGDIAELKARAIALAREAQPARSELRVERTVDPFLDGVAVIVAFRKRKGETLFIDARKLGTMIDRVHRELTDDDIATIADTYHAWRGDKSVKKTYEDVPGFCKSATLDDILARAAEQGEPPFILVLDSLEDPHNVGSLLRSAEGAGVHGVIFPTHRQAPISPSAVKASAGAVEHLLLYPAEDLPGTLTDLHSRGVRVVGADGDAPLTARQTDLRGPLALVVGSEGKGLGAAVRRRADAFMRIPMKGAVGSLNAAVAGSILLFEALAQRDTAPAAASPVETVDEPSDKPEPPTPAEAPAEAAKPTRRRSTTKPPKPASPAPAAEASEADDLLPADAAPKPKRRTRKTEAGEAGRA